MAKSLSPAKSNLQASSLQISTVGHISLDQIKTKTGKSSQMGLLDFSHFSNSAHRHEKLLLKAQKQ